MLYRIDVYSLDNNLVRRIDSISQNDIEEIVQELEEKILLTKLPYKLDVVNKIDETIDYLVDVEMSKGNKIDKKSYHKNKAVWAKFHKEVEKQLRKTDYTQLADVPLSSEEKKEYREYRNYLRNLDKLHNNTSIWNAQVPGFEEWKLQLNK